MKFKILLSLELIFIGFLAYSQNVATPKPTLIKDMSVSSLIIYKDENWDTDHHPFLSDLGYDLVGMSIDTSKVYPIIRNTIASKYYQFLNKDRWRICTVVNGYGKIVSVSYWFWMKDDSGIDIPQFEALADRIRNEVTWEITFNKKVTDLFYCSFSFPGPKF
jgi:hypothetical protein